MDKNDEAIQHLKRADQRFRAVLFVISLAVGLFIAFWVVRVSNQVQVQTTFIVNYLECIGKTPVSQRGPNATTGCFDRYAPKGDK